MLKDVKINTTRDPICAIIAQINGRKSTVKRLQEGVYECAHWSFTRETSNRLEEYDNLPDKDIFCYGVCDSPEQLLAALPQTIASDRAYCISMVSLEKKNESPEGGWRWHKWGPYIGTQKKTCEYLYDEPEVEKVYTYHIYRIL
jgi:hypothetical protein